MRSLVVGLWMTVLSITLASAQNAPSLSSPANGSTLSGSDVTITWTAGSGVIAYWLSIGTAMGGTNLFNQNEGTSLSQAVSGLPTNGSAIYLRLWYQTSTWLSIDYSFTAASGGGSTPPAITSPAPGSTLSSPSVSFTWSAGSGASQYWLYVGTTAGAGNLFNQNEATNLTATVSGLPANGSTVYVRLWYLSGTWLYLDSSFATSSGAQTNPAMTSPAPGSTLSSNSATFTWSAGTGITSYWLSLFHPPGPANGASPFYSSGSITSTSIAVNGLPSDGSTLYARLWWTRDGTAWTSSDYTYTSYLGETVASPTTPTGPTTPALNQAVQYQTGGVTQSSTGNPVQYGFSYDGAAPSAWGGASDTHTWTTSGAHTVRALARSTPNPNVVSFPSSSLSVTVGAVDPAVTSPAPGSTLTSTSVNFSWSAGTGVTAYWVYLYHAPGPPAATQFFDSGSLSTASVTANGLPSDGSALYLRLFWQRSGAWSHADFTFTCYTAVNAGNWTQLAPAAAPPARTAPGMAYDSTRHRAVVFGGVNSTQTGVLGDTWEFDGTTWAQVGGSGPYARAGQAMAFDSAHGRTVLFGGGAAPHVYSSDTWLWDGTNWALGSPSSIPPARAGAGMAYDSGRGRAVMFGGVESGDDAPLGDTWEWNGATWAQSAPATSPTPRAGTALAFDPTRGRTVLFGGKDASGYQADTWEWDGGVWRRIVPATSPSARGGHSMGFDAARGKVVLFGGGQGRSTSYGDTWTWDGTTWTQLSLSPSPAARSGAGMVYDAARLDDVLFAGAAASTVFGDTWSLTSPGVATPAMASPAPGSTLTSTSTTFTWTAGSGVTQYWLWVGTTAGGRDLYNQSAGSSLSATASGLPTGSVTVYVRLFWTTDGASWPSHDYTYTSMR